MRFVPTALFATVLAGATLMTAVPSVAAPIVVTYTGHVESGYDTTGDFGTANSDLSGLAFTATYTFDPAQGNYYGDGITENEVYGGTYYSAQSPLVSALITISGHTVSVDGSYQSSFYSYNDGLTSEQDSSAQLDEITAIGGQEDQYLSNSVYSFSPQYPASLSGPYSGPVTEYSDGEFRNYIYTPGQVLHYSYATLTSEYLTVGLAGGVPEPATWSLMILGFGAVGGAMRRRQRISTKVSFA